MTGEQKIVLMGIPVTEKAYKPGPNFKAVPCGICEQDCWMGPKQQEKIAEGGEVMCAECAIKETIKAGGSLSDIQVSALTQNSGSTFDAGKMN